MGRKFKELELKVEDLKSDIAFLERRVDDYFHMKEIENTTEYYEKEKIEERIKELERKNKEIK